MNDDLENLKEQLFNAASDNKYLRGQITYLQEEIGTLEDTIMRLERDLNDPENYVL